MVKITVSSFKRLLGEALRAVKPEHMMIEIATKIATYNKTQYIMRAARRTECRAVQVSHGGRTVQVVPGHKL